MKIETVSTELIGKIDGFKEVYPGVWVCEKDGSVFVTGPDEAILVTPKG